MQIFSYKNKKIVWGGCSVFLILTLSFLISAFQNPESIMAVELTQRLQPPSFSHLFGTDEFGSDILGKVFAGGQKSLIIAFMVVLMSGALGYLIGLFSGFKGGFIDLTLMRVIDIFYAVPNFLICLAILSILPASRWNLILALTLTGWVGYARLVRSEVLEIKEREFVQAAAALGCSWWRIVFFHITPNLSGPLIVHSVFSVAAIILTEAGLSFLGLGSGANEASWGALLYSGKQFLALAPHITLFPAIAICMTILSLQVLGEGLQDHFNPQKT